jgi:hypothetical protein
LALHRTIRATFSEQAQDYIALFAAAKKRLQERTAEFNREMPVRHGYCNAAPFLVIDNTIYDGENGAFLYAQLDLIGFDDWNVIMMAADLQTKQMCELAAHPGSIPVHSQNMAKRVGPLGVGGKSRLSGLSISHPESAYVGRERRTLMPLSTHSEH